jgi:pimeloyl-ACP methyl ester carboxylesterase
MAEGDARPVLAYLPGLDGSAELLFLQEEELATRFRVLKLPWRTEGEFDYDDLVSDVVDLLDREAAGRATILAESFGGTVALRFALEHPNRVDRLVVLNSFPYFPNRGLARFGRALARFAPSPVVAAMRAFVDVPTLSLEGVPASAQRRFLAAANRQPLAAYARRLALVEAFDVRERIHEIRVPSLFVAAERDRVVPSRESAWMAARIAGAHFRLVPNVGHATLLTPGFSILSILDERGPSTAGAATGPRPRDYSS